MAFQAGRQVEVYGEEEGFSESWAVATVVEVKEAASSIIPTLVLHYNEVGSKLAQLAMLVI